MNKKRILASLLALTMAFGSGAVLAGAEEADLNYEAEAVEENVTVAEEDIPDSEETETEEETVALPEDEKSDEILDGNYGEISSFGKSEAETVTSKLQKLSLKEAKKYLDDNGYWYNEDVNGNGDTCICIQYYDGMVGKESGNFIYINGKNGVKVIRYTGTLEDIVIPSYINGEKVTGIAWSHYFDTYKYDANTEKCVASAGGGDNGFPLMYVNHADSLYIPSTMTDFSFHQDGTDDKYFLDSVTRFMRDHTTGELIIKCEKGSAADKWLQESIGAEPELYSNIKIEYVTGIPITVPVFKSFSCTTNAVRINWSAVSGASGYRVYRYNTATKKWETAKTISGGSTVTYRDTGLKAGTNYKYKVKAYVKENGKTYWGDASSTITTATKPTTVKITKAGKTSTAVRLYWNKVDCSGYKLQQYDTATKTWKTVKVLKSTDTNYKVSGLKKNTAYKFRIQAYKTAGTQKAFSAWSATKTVTTKK